MQALKPADRATQYLRRAVNTARVEGLRALPGSRTLSLAAGVSRETMLKAMRRLCEQGLLDMTVRGKTLICQAEDSQPHVPTGKEPSWASLAQQLSEDIQRRRWVEDPELPSVNRLREHYRVSRPTMVRALERLCQRSVVKRSGRHYRIALPRTSRGGGEVVLVARGRHDGSVAPIGPHQREIVSTLDIQCSKAGVSLVPSACRFVERDLLPTEDWSNPATVASRRKAVLGFVVLTMAPGVDHGRFVRGVQSPGVPVAMIDELPEGGSAFKPAPRSAPVLWIRALSDQLAGYEVASYLLSHGHRQVAYAFFSDDYHTAARLAGMRNAYAEAGMPDGVAVVSCDQPARVVDTWHEFRTRTAARMVDTMQSLLMEQLPEAPFEQLPAVAGRTGLGSLRERFSEVFNSGGFPHLTLGAPLFSELARNSSATAWVLQGPELATAAVDVLQATGRRVPEDVSVMCFDDSPEAVSRRIAVYSFNPADAARAALAAILGPSYSPLRRGRVKQMAIRGTVIERESVARVA